MKKFLRTVGFVLLLLVVLTAGFAAGVFYEQRAFFPLPVTGLFEPPGYETTRQSDGIETGLIQQAYRTIQEHYADREALDETNLTYGAITGMVDSLGDTGHSRFLTPEMVAAEQRQIQGEFEGIGALLNVNDNGNPVILAPMDNSPALKAGLKPGDIIMAVNGEDVSQAPLSEVVRRVLGPAGTQVTLTILSPDDNEARDVTITRAKIVVQNVTWQMLPGTDIAHIRIASYSQNVTRDLVEAINNARGQGTQGILLDLRNNPGGLLHEAIGVVSQFLEDGYVLKTKDADGNISPISVRNGGSATDIPLVVLINQGSASAAEITAGAMQDYDRATLVGETTFGTGTVLNQFRMSDGSAILLATELWLTPNEREIWHQGIEPDVVVELPADVSLSIPETERDLTAEGLQSLEDTQLKKGIELLEEKIRE